MSLTYVSAVSRENVIISFLLVALNDIDTLAGHMGNAYLNVLCKEKIFTICGLEIREENLGKVVVIIQMLYGLKSSVATC